MAAICQWNCSDNYVDDLLDTPIEYTSPNGGKEWLPLHNETGKALYPPTSMGIGPQSLSAYTGAGGRATFSFLGQEVAVYGSEFGTGTESSYTLDGEVVAVHTSQSLGLGVLLFYAGVLSATTHTLVIEVVGASAAAPFTLDWIEYNNTARGATSPVSNPSYVPSQPQSSASASSLQGGATVSVLSASHASKPSFSGAALAGGVAGGLVGLTAIVLAYLALRSRRRWRMNGSIKYAYGEVAQYDSDTLGVPTAEVGSIPTVVVTNADDANSLRGINPSSVSMPPSNQTVLGFREHRTARELGNSKQESFSGSPPAYAP
ncbi:hypothetical protein GSI_11620 [Ganoderma sinense ZZ0214-1]|uniref:Transmembrane protein n=1 Tax=Ganoderma sinense ZZ0214-1 TaxID=1077348 RepID=A0A2G8RWK3_9APHY|nr:hypothetical protein GSI_11620 [Ganoderma sinense ZZ0214-1]